ncbi:hypothetical protein WJX75_003768 [Coccomyxa subellipsoidea]|uniref:Uncharacterized protein n=1 Tax=Coccomyxa subellipsoidea TaxID=248742 RepID=A0ABR2YDY1_9CHLO
MLPESVGQSTGAPAVVSALFLLIAIISVNNLLVTKLKLFAILAFSAVLRGIGYANSAANIAHPSRELYIVYQTLETVGYGASVVVLFLVVASWLEIHKEPRPPGAKILAVLCHVLPVMTGILAIIIAPIAFTKIYGSDDLAANKEGRKLELATFWVFVPF